MSIFFIITFVVTKEPDFNRMVFPVIPDLLNRNPSWPQENACSRRERLSAVRTITHERTSIITPREDRRSVCSHHADHHPTSDCRARGQAGRDSVNSLFAHTDKHPFVFADIERMIKPRDNDDQEEKNRSTFCHN